LTIAYPASSVGKPNLELVHTSNSLITKSAMSDRPTTIPYTDGVCKADDNETHQKCSCNKCLTKPADMPTQAASPAKDDVHVRQGAITHDMLVVVTTATAISVNVHQTLDHLL
jgi:hypothetical protein